MIINAAYTLIFNTGLFPDACRAWQSRAVAGKTWAQFKIDFATAHREFWLTNQTAQQSGFHSANMMIEQGRTESVKDTAEAIARLATATASDCGTVATLTTTNAKLATQLEASNALSAQLTNEISTLKNKIKPGVARTATRQNYEQRQLLLVAWVPGGHITHKCNVQHEKERIPRCGNQEQHDGRRSVGQGMIRRGS
jgi:hypothetical protein